MEEFLQKNIDHYEDHGFCLFDIFDRQTNEFIWDAGLIYEALAPENQDIEVWISLCALLRGLMLRIIETEDCYLREFHETDDFELSFDLWSDLKILNSMECEPCSEEKITEKLARYKSWMNSFGFTNFAAFTKDSHDFVGSCGMSLFHDPEGDRNPLEVVNGEKYENRDVELGYVLHEKYWGRGGETQLARSCVDFVFENNLDIKRVFAVTTLSNIASQKVLNKIGFEFVEDVEGKEYGREKFYILKRQ